MPRIYDNESGALLGTVTSEEVQYLVDQLEEEDSEDKDYYIDRATLAWFEEHGVDSALITLLLDALGDRQGMEIRWEAD